MNRFKLPIGNYWLYVLECNGGFFYIGTTTDVGRRFKQHISGCDVSAKFTKKHRPIRVLYKAELGYMPYEIAEEYEDCATLEMMMKYGPEKCAGGRFLKPISIQDVVKIYRNKDDRYKCSIIGIMPKGETKILGDRKNTYKQSQKLFRELNPGLFMTAKEAKANRRAKAEKLSKSKKFQQKNFQKVSF